VEELTDAMNDQQAEVNDESISDANDNDSAMSEEGFQPAENATAKSKQQAMRHKRAKGRNLTTLEFLNGATNGAVTKRTPVRR